MNTRILTSVLFLLVALQATTSEVHARAELRPSGVRGATASVAGTGRATVQGSSVEAFGAKCNGLINDTVAIKAAFTAANAYGGAISFPAGTCMTDSLNIPANVTAKFEAGSILSINGGQTVTINGPIEASVGQHFAGSGVVRFNATQSLVPLNISWWGVRGDNRADDTRAVQAAFDALNAGMVMDIPLGYLMKITSTVTILDKHNITLRGQLDGSYMDANQATQFIWAGEAGGTLLRIDRVRNSTFKGFGLFAAPASGARSGAKVLCYVTQDGAGHNISSGNLFEEMTFHLNTYQSPSFALSFDNASQTNNEFHIVRRNLFAGVTQTYPNQVATGIYLGHVNVKHVLVEANYAIGLATFIDSNAGSFHAINNRFSSVARLYNGAIGDPVVITGDTSEDTKQLAVLQGFGQVPLNISGGRYNDIRVDQGGSTSSAPYISILNSVSLTVAGCLFTPANGSLGDALVKDVTGDQSLIWEHNHVQNITEQNLLSALQSFRNMRATGVRSAGLYGTLVKGTVDALTSTNVERPLIGLVSDTLRIGTGELEVKGLAPVTGLRATIIGNGGTSQHILLVVAKDAAGNRTLVSNEINVTSSNSRLDGANHIQLDWSASPGANSYDIIERDLKTGGHRLLATVGAVTTYNITSNPNGPLAYSLPTYNETGMLKLATTSAARVITFPDGDAAPSVKASNVFKTSNTGATTITNFSQGTDGQEIFILMSDANTTIRNSASIITRSGRDIPPAANTTDSFVRIDGAWYQKN